MVAKNYPPPLEKASAQPPAPPARPAQPNHNSVSLAPANVLNNFDPNADPLENSPAVSSEKDQKLFETLLNGLLPMTPKEIQALRSRVDHRDQALNNPAPKILASRTITFQPVPGVNAPMVTLTPGLVTALVFTTPHGQPWPIVSSALGDGTVLKAESLKDADHQLLVSPLASHGRSNLLVGLKGLDLPVMIRLEITSGLDPNRRIDGVVNFQIKNALHPTAQATDRRINPELTLAYDLLEGRSLLAGSFLTSEPVLPESLFFQKDKGGSIYVKTPFQPHWPAWIEKVSSPSGVSVYEIRPVKEIIVNQSGRLIRVNLPRAQVLAGE
jgi:hypothetical protein